MKSKLQLFGASLAIALSAVATGAAAQTPPPPIPPAAKMQAQPFLQTAGMSDVYEITSSEIALKKSQTPALRRYATMMIQHHTVTTNNALTAAKAAAVPAPPPVLNSQFRAMISELNAASPADFDRLYVGQQVASHQGALELQTAYSTGGDVPQLRTAAKGTVPIVKQHLDEIVGMQRSM